MARRVRSVIFELYEDKLMLWMESSAWIEAGEYPVVRMFDKDRVLVDAGTNGKRQLTVVPLYMGTLKNAQQVDFYDE